jgi:uroporphyrin-III C-methyltransferase/precorrin-2 dehydrogenase/sirohydrochlorin ferrochelatase
VYRYLNAILFAQEWKMRHRTIPVSLVVENDKRALVVGGGNIAQSRLLWLLGFGARVDVMAPAFSDNMTPFRAHRDVHLIEKRYEDEAEGYLLVVGATDDMEVNRRVARSARLAKVPVNVVDAPELCSFFVPATVQRGPLHVAVGTDGASPVLAGRLARLIGGLLPDAFGDFVQWLQKARCEVKQRVDDTGRRRRAMRCLASKPAADAFLLAQESNRTIVGNRLLNEALDVGRIGRVYLVGAGPGDPELFTIKGLRALHDSDAVLHDGLASDALLSELGPDVQIVNTSKRAGCAVRTQDDINRLMVTLAREGKTVCRLKGGDPCVFGRAAEEAGCLANAGIPFEIINGVSSVVAAPACAGIPLTSREHSSYFHVVTGHEAPDKLKSLLNWQFLGTDGGTVVFLMGASRFSEIAVQMLTHGRSRGTPVALISRGTMPDQRVIRTTLGDIVESPPVDMTELKRPVLIVVGDVVRLGETLDWFETDETRRRKDIP